ncbi:MAG TPA: XrtA/PEP-CTERM system TPR-repeat protein PrsT [Noviherbaspirillum sp.]|nr:XrtA/PEP-CTERM system TPR-repeat protein PrsT [Noviherbaspirillum sp.]
MLIIQNKKSASIAMVSGAILLAAALSGCSQQVTAQKLVSEAAEYKQKGDNKAAIIQLKNALQKNPDDSEARYLLGTLYNDTGDPQSAEKELRKAISLGMSSTKVLPSLGKALLMQGQFQKLLDETHTAAQDNTEIAVLRGNAYLALGQNAEAKEAFELARKNNADNPDALIGLAKHAMATKNLDVATQLSEQAVTKNPANLDAWLFKADLLRAQAQIEPALAAYEKVLELKNDHGPARIAKASIEISRGKFDAAKEDIAAARKSNPKGLMVYYTQALLDFRQRNLPAALESLNQVLRAAPDHMPSVLLAGAVQLDLGATQQAEQHLKKYLEKNPGDLFARKLLATAMLKNGDTQRAVDVLADVNDEAKKDTQLLVLAGESQMQAKNFKKAIEYFEKASTLAPENAMIHTALAKSQLGQGDSVSAVTELEKAMNLDPKSSQAGIMLVMTHLRQKNYDKALAAAKTLESAQPKDPQVHNLKGSVYLAKKDIAAARASFERALALQADNLPAITNLAHLDMQEKKPEAAKKRFEAFLETDKKNVQAMTGLAGIALSQGRTDEATAWLERASTENPDALPPALLLSAHYVRIGQTQKALTLARKLQVANPGNPEALAALAQAQLASKDQSAALETFNKLAVAVPTSAQVHYQIASLHVAMKNKAAAEESIKKALSLKPDYLEAQLAQAALEASKGNHAQALSIARKIQQQREKSPAGYLLEGDMLMVQKKPALAVKPYEQAFALDKNGSLLVKLHASLSQSGKGKEADSRLTNWLSEHPDDTPAQLYLATVHLMNGRNATAIKHFQIVTQHDPKNIAALNNLAWAYHQEKNPAALEFAEKAYQIDAKNPAVLDTLGWILVEQGKVPRGVPLLQKAVELAPESMDIRYHLALGLIKSGDKATARSELQRLLSLGKEFAQEKEVRALLAQL